MVALDVRPVFYIIGSLLVVLAVAMLAPMIVDIAAGNPDWVVFGTSSGLTLFFGVSLMLMNRTGHVSLTLRQTFLLTTLSWLLTAAFSALPYLFTHRSLDPTDAFFEAMSGLTTTGSTVIIGLADLPPGLLLWRSLTQWLGGIGIIAMGIAIFPFLRVGGMQLFRSESSDRSDKVVPRAADLALGIGWIYLTLTLMCVIALRFSGMSMFDAVCHALTAVSTGGFSTQDSSIAYWRNPAVEWVLVLFMLAGGLPFVRYISFIRGEFGAFWKDSQVRRFLLLVVIITLALGTWVSETLEMPWPDAIRTAAFNLVSVMTTTGYASTDYSAWGALAVAVFFLVTLLGACTGSTAGGIKMFRFEVLLLVLKAQLMRLYSPHRVMPLTYNGKPVDTDIMLSVMSFGFLFVALMLLFTVALAAIGLDFVTALSGAATALANVGPGLGPIIGPVGNFATLPDSAKWILALAMLLGRLEFFTVLVLFNPNFWRS